MQDNYSKYEDDMDEQFADHAWGEMAKLLDKELPVVAPIPESSGKKKYLLLLLFLLFGTGVGWWTSSQYYAQKTTNEETRIKVITTERDKQNLLETTVVSKVDNKEVGTNFVTQQEQQENISSLKSTATEANAIHEVDSKMTHSSTLKSRNSKIVGWTELKKTEHSFSDAKEAAIVNQVKNNERQSIIEVPKSRTQNINKSRPKKTILENVKPADQANNTSKIKSSNIKSIPEKAVSAALTQPIALLDILKVDELENSKLAEEDLNLYKIETPKKAFWKPDDKGVELAVHSKKLGSIDGFSIGGIIEYRLKTPRLSIQTGLNYEMISTQGEGLSNVFSQKDELNGSLQVGTTGGGQYAPDGTIVDVIFTNENENSYDPNRDWDQEFNNGEVEQVLLFEDFSQLHYVSVPLQLNYRPWASLELNGGVKLSYLLGTTFKNTEAIQIAQNDIDLIFTDSFKSSNARVNNRLRKFDARTFIGATWYPKPSFGLGLKYNLGLTKAFPSLPSTAWSDYRNNSWQLSMVFKF